KFAQDVVAHRDFLGKAVDTNGNGRLYFETFVKRIFWREHTVAYAIVQTGGKQFRVSLGQVVRVPTITAEVGDSVQLEALLTGDGSSIEIGGGTVQATVVEHGRGTKVIVFKKKRRKQYKKTHGHRQNFTAVRIEAIGAQSESANTEASNQEPEVSDSNA